MIGQQSVSGAGVRIGVIEVENEQPLAGAVDGDVVGSLLPGGAVSAVDQTLRHVVFHKAHLEAARGVALHVVSSYPDRYPVLVEDETGPSVCTTNSLQSYGLEVLSSSSGAGTGASA